MNNMNWFEKTIEDQQAIAKAAAYGFLQRGAKKY